MAKDTSGVSAGNGGGDFAKDLVNDFASGASFDEAYARVIEPALAARDKARLQAVQTLGLAILAGALLALVEFLLLPALPLPQLWIMTIVLAGVAGYIPLRRVAKAAKADVLAALCQPLGVTCEVGGFEPPAFSALRDLRLVPPSDHDRFEDHFAGERHGRPFDLYEASLVQGSGRSARTVFRGQLFKLAYPRPFGGVTVVLRDSGWLDRFQCPPGLAKVGLEDLRFERTFEVFGSDQVEARALLTPTFMEQLLALEAAYAGQHVRCAFTGGEVLIAIEGPNRFEIGSMFTSLVDRARAEAMAGDLAAVFGLMDAFAAAPEPALAPAPEPVVTPSAPAVRPAPRRRRRATAA